MRFLLTILLFLGTAQAPGTTRLRLLLRDASDHGVAGVALTLRADDGSAFTITTDARGVAESGALSGATVWLMNGHGSDGRGFQADSYPAGTGFRLVLIPGQTREALLRLDNTSLVLDPAMIFTPDQAEATHLVMIDQLLSASASVAPASVAPPSLAAENNAPANADPGLVQPGWSVLWCVFGIGFVLIVLALAVGLLRRRVS